MTTNSTKTITGRIIRILDTRTAIVNLGKQDGITASSVFSILGDPERIVDPFTDEELGTIRVVKSKLKASRVYAKFTVATTRWTINTFRPSAASSFLDSLSSMYQTEVVDQGELRVDPKDIEGWKAQTEIPVKIGDIVEVEVTIASQPSLPIMQETSDSMSHDNGDNQDKDSD